MVLWDIVQLVCIAGYCQHFSFKKEYGGDEEEVLWTHQVKKTAKKNGGKQRRRGRPAKTWFQDIKDWVTVSPKWRLIRGDGAMKSQ